MEENVAIQKLNEDGKIIISQEQYNDIKDQIGDCNVFNLLNGKVMVELNIPEI